MLKTEAVIAEVRLFALLRRPLVLESLTARGAKVALEAGPEDRRSRHLDEQQSDPEATARFRRCSTPMTHTS